MNRLIIFRTRQEAVNAYGMPPEVEHFVFDRNPPASAMDPERGQVFPETAIDGRVVEWSCKSKSASTRCVSRKQKGGRPESTAQAGARALELHKHGHSWKEVAVIVNREELCTRKHTQQSIRHCARRVTQRRGKMRAKRFHTSRRPR